MSQQLEKLIKKVEKFQANNDLISALSIYQKICKLTPDNINAWMAYGSIAGNIGRFDTAESAFKKACAINSIYGKQHELLIQVLDLQNKYSKAIKILLKAIASGNSPPDAAFRIGMLYGKNGDFGESVEWILKHIEDGNSNAHAYYCLASAYESLGNYAQSEKYFLLSINIDSHNSQLYNSYGAMLHKSGRLGESITQYKKSLSLDKQYPPSHYNLANAYHLLGKYTDALDQFSIAINLKPDYIEAIVGKGKCHFAMNANMLAVTTYQAAIKINNKCHDAYANLIYTYMALGDFSAAEKALHQAQMLEPKNIDTKCAAIQLYEKQGLFEKAEDIIRPLLTSDNDHPDVVLAYASLCKKLNECDKAVELINHKVKDQHLTAITKSTLYFSAGKIQDHLKNFNEAFLSYETANQLQSFHNNKEEITQSRLNIETIFSNETMKNTSRSSHTVDAPIFIVGMPRSGTTLVEQIISSHANVYGAGELPYLDTIVKQHVDNFTSGHHKANKLKSSDSHFFSRIAEEYISKVDYKTTTKQYFTDKMPHNFRLIGLISLMFPNAKIIHCTRNPIDNCLSIYFSNFNSSHPYANYLSDLAEYYTGYYQKIMQHWSTVNTVPIHTVRYEDLVNDQKNITKKLISHCGLPWDENCLNFHQSKRDVATISYDQVREPIYTKSIARWHNYEEHIEPLLKHFKEQI